MIYLILCVYTLSKMKKSSFGTVHKRHSKSGGGVCPVRHFSDKGERGFSDVKVHTFWFKTVGFFEIYGVSSLLTDKKG